MKSSEAHASAAEPLAYEFGDFRLDARQRLLFGKGGVPITLPGRAFDTLHALVANHDQLLDKPTLMKAVWPNVIVEENNLSQHISLLRRVLGESPGEHQFIVTVPGRGYQFVAKVARIAPPTAVATGRSPNVGPRDSVAVLPFANLTGDVSRDYFGDGMAEELLHRLAHVPGLKIAARTSAFAYKGRNIDVRQIARSLGVGAILEGSVRVADGCVRVTAQLVDGETGYHVWSHGMERKLEDLFALQDELANAVVRALLPGAHVEAEPATRPPPTLDLQAYELCMQARAISTRPTEENLQTSLRMLELAVARDPAFARAISALALTRTRMLNFDYAMAGGLAAAKADAERALTLDPRLTEARQALGIVNAASGNWIQAEEHFLSAGPETDPLVNTSFSIFVLQSVGHTERALGSAMATYRSAPFLPVAPLNLALIQVMRGQDADAALHLAATEALGYPSSISVFQDLAAHLDVRAQRYTSAARRMVRTLSDGMRSAGGEPTVALVFAALEDPGQRADAVQAVLRLCSSAQPNRLSQTDRKRMLLWLTMLGAIDDAHDFAARSLEHYHDSAGSVGMAWGVLWVPEMQPFRRHPRFAQFTERLGLIPYWRRFGAPDDP